MTNDEENTDKAVGGAAARNRTFCRIDHRRRWRL
jgi:hypothetical protein